MMNQDRDQVNTALQAQGPRSALHPKTADHADECGCVRTDDGECGCLRDARKEDTREFLTPRQ